MDARPIDYVMIGLLLCSMAAAWFRGSQFLALPLWLRLTIAVPLFMSFMAWIVLSHL